MVLGKGCHLSGPQVPTPPPLPAPSTHSHPSLPSSQLCSPNKWVEEVCRVVYNTVQEGGATSIHALKVFQAANHRTLRNYITCLSDDPGSPSGCRSIESSYDKQRHGRRRGRRNFLVLKSFAFCLSCQEYRCSQCLTWWTGLKSNSHMPSLTPALTFYSPLGPVDTSPTPNAPSPLAPT